MIIVEVLINEIKINDSLFVKKIIIIIFESLLYVVRFKDFDLKC